GSNVHPKLGNVSFRRGRFIEGSFEPTDTIGRCKLPLGISPRPVVSASLLREVKVILTTPRAGSRTRSIFFGNQVLRNPAELQRHRTFKMRINPKKIAMRVLSPLVGMGA